MRRHLCFVLLFTFCISSCSIERRHYRPGFYVEQHAQKSSKGTEPVTAKLEETAIHTAQPDTPPASENLLATADSAPTAFAAIASRPERQLLQSSIAQAQQQVLHKAEGLKHHLKKFHKGEPLPEDISDALTISLIMLLVFGSATVLFLANPAAILDSSDSDSIWLAASPMVTMVFLFFIPGLIRKCRNAMRNAPRGSRARMMGGLAIFFCLLCAALSIGTFIYLMMNPELFLIVAIAAALALLVGLLHVII